MKLSHFDVLIHLKFQACGGYWRAFFIVSLSAQTNMMMLGPMIIVMNWMSAQSKAVENSEEMNNLPYEILLCIAWVMLNVKGTMKAFFMAKFVAKGTTTLHEEMLQRLIKSPMLFYDTVSVGTIINRFVIDMNEGKSTLH